MTFENKKFLDKIGITHLWEKIENRFINSEELNVVVEAIDEVKADAEDHNIKTYNNLNQIGLSNDDMSSTDFLTNIKAINTALGEDDSILYLTTTNADNLHLSAIDKLSSDVNKELGFIVENNGKFMSISLSKAIYSEDGVNWIDVALPDFTDPYFLTYGNGKFVAISGGYYNTSAIYSEDGINWMVSEIPHIETTEWGAITYGNGKFVAVTGSSSGLYGAYSEDGINWNTMKTYIHFCHSVTYGNGKFVAVGTCRDENYNPFSGVAYSEDGINWEYTQMPPNHQWYSVTYGNGKFVAGATDSPFVAYSEDGINWIETELPVSNSWESDCMVSYCKDRFVVTSNYLNYGAYSTNGIDWNEISFPISCKSVAYGNGKFVAVAYDFNDGSNVVAHSDDCINWTLTTLPISDYWSNTIYGGDITKQYTSVPLSLKISRTGNTYNAITIDLIYNSGVEATYIYSCVYNKETDTADDTLSKFVITTHPKGFVSKEEVSSDSAMELLYETGIIDPITNSNGELLTDEDGNVFVI